MARPSKTSGELSTTTFTLTWSDDNNTDQSFQFEASADVKPESSGALAIFLRDFALMKIPELGAKVSTAPSPNPTNH